MQLETFVLDFFLPLHSPQRCCLAMSSSDEIARLLNLGAADSHPLNGVISEYFAERMLTRKRMKKTQVRKVNILSVEGNQTIIKKNYKYIL